MNWNRWILIGGLIIFTFIVLMMWLIMLFFKPSPRKAETPSAIVMIIAAPTSTTYGVVSKSPTPTLQSLNGIQKGVYIQISGTGSDGLKLRSGPGKDYSAHFIGMEAEVFLVNDGPVVADGYTWWHLVAPYDQTRNGWAVSEYLLLVVPSH
jgi:hypothetical protein